eukprot:PhF_6_TR31535/c0_g1_i1/m.46502
MLSLGQNSVVNYDEILSQFTERKENTERFIATNIAASTKSKQTPPQQQQQQQQQKKISPDVKPSSEKRTEQQEQNITIRFLYDEDETNRSSSSLYSNLTVTAKEKLLKSKSFPKDESEAVFNSVLVFVKNQLKKQTDEFVVTSEVSGKQLHPSSETLIQSVPLDDILSLRIRSAFREEEKTTIEKQDVAPTLTSKTSTSSLKIRRSDTGTYAVQSFDPSSDFNEVLNFIDKEVLCGEVALRYCTIRDMSTKKVLLSPTSSGDAQQATLRSSLTSLGLSPSGVLQIEINHQLMEQEKQKAQQGWIPYLKSWIPWGRGQQQQQQPARPAAPAQHRDPHQAPPPARGGGGGGFGARVATLSSVNQEDKDKKPQTFYNGTNTEFQQ